MAKWLMGLMSAIMLAFCGWIWAFIIMGYQAKADIQDFKQFAETHRHEQAEIEAEVKTIREISLRTEKNTETIREYLLKRSFPVKEN